MQMQKMLCIFKGIISIKSVKTCFYEIKDVYNNMKGYNKPALMACIMLK
jgi:hypothetical protein